MTLKKVCQNHVLLLTINASGVNLSSYDTGAPEFVTGVDEVSDIMTTLEEKRTGERLRG